MFAAGWAHFSRDLDGETRRKAWNYMHAGSDREARAILEAEPGEAVTTDALLDQMADMRERLVKRPEQE